jgi:DNA-binding CsgD family transcriptional regulator
MVAINERCSMQTDGSRRLIAVCGVLTANYALGDGPAEAMAMVNLIATGAASQVEVAQAFGLSTRQVRRYQRRGEDDDLATSHRRGRQLGDVGVVRIKASAIRMAHKLKDDGVSTREIARRIGVCEKSVRKLLKRMGWQPKSVFVQPALPGLEPPLPVEAPVAPVTGELPVVPEEPCAISLDTDPTDRHFDRLLACMGALDDALPLFQTGRRIPHAGVLLAVPALIQSGFLSVAREVYGSIGPAFYGLRSTLLVLLFMALLRIRRPEGLKEQVPAELGMLVGLDRSPEVKTLRHKLERLASLRRAEQFGQELARLRVETRGETLGFLYVDGHVRVYHGKHHLPKAHVTRMRISLPATSDYWINDQVGDPLFMVTAKANAGLVQVLPDLLAQTRKLMGDRPITIVFDRGGWSPALFSKLESDGFHILTYRKGEAEPIAEWKFTLHKARLDGREVEYWLNDQILGFQFGKEGRMSLRQVTRLQDGHQTQVITTRFDLPAIEVAHRMFQRWRQENFFKYMRQEYLLDALVDYGVEPDDPARIVPNPERRRMDKEIAAVRQELAKLQRDYGAAAMEHQESKRPTLRGFKLANDLLGQKIRTARMRLDALMARKATMAAKIAVGEAVKEPIVKLATERKHLTDMVKMVAYQIESDLLSMISPHFARSDDEGRTLVQNLLASAADLEVTPKELRVKVSPLSSPHRTRVLATLCEELNLARTTFPGSRLQLRFSVSGSTH